MTKQLVTDNTRILELKEKIQDEGYIQGAIQRIALVLSNKLIDVKDCNDERFH